MYGMKLISGSGKADHAMVILHGILQTRDDLAAPFGTALAARAGGDVDIYVYGYDHTRQLVLNGDLLADELATMTAARIDLVGYSMGGLVARLGASERLNPRLRRVITVATPNRGALGPAQLTLLGQVARQAFHCFTAIAPRTAGVKDLTQAAAIMKARRTRLMAEYPSVGNPVSGLAYASIPALFYNPDRTDFEFGPSINLTLVQGFFLAARLKLQLEAMQRSHDGIVTEESCQINRKQSHDWSEVHLASAGPNGEPQLCHAVLDICTDHDHSSIMQAGAAACAELVWLLASTPDWSTLKGNKAYAARARFDTD